MTTESLPYSVLIADDSADIRVLWKKRLEQVGFKRIEVVENGRLAVERALALKPEFIILDCIMPVLDGLSALREIRPFLPQSVILIASSVSERDKVVQFKEAGADQYFLKMMDSTRFNETVTKALAILQSRFPVKAS